MLSLRTAIATLRRHYGKQAPPVSREPFHLILWEQVGYLVPDAQRRRAFAALRSKVGLRPAAIVAAPTATLQAIARMGGAIAARERALRLRRSAERVVNDWNGDLRGALRLPLPEARRALARFAMIGEPGADKILVFAGKARLLPLDSNGLRVLGRLGIITDAKDYRSTYRRAQERVARVLPRSADWLATAYAVLRLHGQQLCHRNAPACSHCPLRAGCPSSSFERGA